MKICQRCGLQLSDDSAFCSNCGNAVNNVQQQPVNQNANYNAQNANYVNQNFNQPQSYNYQGQYNQNYQNPYLNQMGQQYYNPARPPQAAGSDGLAVAAKIFLIISCVVQGFFLLPLAWCLPITITLFGKMNRGEYIGTGLKVCTLIFVNTIAGILLLCRDDNAY